MVAEIISFLIVGTLALIYTIYKLLPFYQIYCIRQKEKLEEEESDYFPRAITAMRESELVRLIISSKSKSERSKALNRIKSLNYSLHNKVNQRYFS